MSDKDTKTQELTVSDQVCDSVAQTCNRIDVSKAFILRYHNGLTDPEIAKRFGVTKQAVNKALKPFSKLIKDYDAAKAHAKHQQEILESILFQLDGKLVDPDTIQKAPLNQIAWARDSIFKALRLLQEKSTANVSHLVVDEKLDELRAQRRAIEADIYGDDGVQDAEYIEYSM